MEEASRVSRKQCYASFTLKTERKLPQIQRRFQPESNADVCPILQALVAQIRLSEESFSHEGQWTLLRNGSVLCKADRPAREATKKHRRAINLLLLNVKYPSGVWSGRIRRYTLIRTLCTISFPQFSL